MMTAPEPDGIVWHTSSYSNGAGLRRGRLAHQQLQLQQW